MTNFKKVINESVVYMVVAVLLFLAIASLIAVGLLLKLLTKGVL